MKPATPVTSQVLGFWRSWVWSCSYRVMITAYHPEVILAGRRINDSMACHVADETVKLMLRKGLPVLGSKVLVLGLTFKENCPDVRNTKVVDIVKALQNYNTQVDVYDPWIDIAEAEYEYGLKCLAQTPTPGQYSAIVLAVGHQQFMALGEAGIKAWGQPGAVVFDVKSILPLGAADGSPPLAPCASGNTGPHQCSARPPVLGGRVKSSTWCLRLAALRACQCPVCER